MSEKDTQIGVVNSLLEGMNSILSAKTVVGQPTKVGDTVIIPLVDVTFGVAAGSGKDNGKTSTQGMGGMGGKMSPNAVLIIQNGTTRLLSIKNQDNISKILDMVPEVVHRLSKDKNGGLSDEEISEVAFPGEDDQT